MMLNFILLIGITFSIKFNQAALQQNVPPDSNLFLSRLAVKNIAAKRQQEADTLLLTQVLFRHGDRTPLKEYKTNPYKDDYNKIYGIEGFGQLTPIGRKQAYNLGVYLRRRYDGYLSRRYSKDEVFVQSSDTERTIMTAMNCINGLYSVGTNSSTQQAIPVHVLSKCADNKLAFVKKCNRYEYLYAQNLKSENQTKLNQHYDDFYKFLEMKSGNKITYFEDVYYLYDTMFINNIYNLTLPMWTNGVFPNKMAPIANIEFVIYTTTEEMKRLYVGPLLEEFINNMDNRARNYKDFSLKNHPKAKMFLYAGHDTTISSLFNVLGVFDGQGPPYTAAVMFELHNIKGSIQVRIFYRPDQTDQTYELELQRCPPPCSLKKFKLAYYRYWKTFFGWEIECAV